MDVSKNSVAAMRALHTTYPERAQSLSDYLLESNKKAKALVDWREQQLIRFIESLSLNADELGRGYVEKRITKVAWAARNLLELAIWVDYCNLSDVHAKQFRDDSARDLLGFSKVIQAIYTESQGMPSPGLDRGMQDIGTVAEKLFGVKSINDDFKWVLDAAKEVGRETEFRSLNKLFSKFAHPSSLALNSVVLGAIEADAGIRAMFFADGVDFAISSLTKIREFILGFLPLPAIATH